MKRICLTLLALCASISFAGCCYRPYTFDQCTGRGYGGGWEPCCGGPLDPLGLFCCGQGGYNPWYGGGYSPYGNYASSQMSMGGPAYGNPGCSTCGTEPMTFAPEGMPMQPMQTLPLQTQPMPGGGLKPEPDPKMQQEKSNSPMTFVMPPNAMPMYRPVQYVPAQPRVYRTSQVPTVQAH